MPRAHTPTRRSLRLTVMLAAVAAVGALTLAPRRLVAPARGEFMQLMDAATAGTSMWVSYGQVELVLNMLMFVPLGGAIALLLPRRGWPWGVVAGFVLSAIVEYAQTAIPGRVPDAQDVLSNTIGTALGVALVTLWRAAAAGVRRSTQRGSATRT